jgi:hypothetical protein
MARRGTGLTGELESETIFDGTALVLPGRVFCIELNRAGKRGLMSSDNMRRNERRGPRGKQGARLHQQSRKPNRPSGDQVGDAKRNYERYVALARDAAAAGDAIEAENYYQHAEHYLRTMREHIDRRRQPGAAA